MVLLDFRLNESFPNKILSLSKAQGVQFIEKSQVFTLLKNSGARPSSHNRGSNDSRMSGKRSLFDTRIETPKMSLKNQAFD